MQYISPPREDLTAAVRSSKGYNPNPNLTVL